MSERTFVVPGKPSPKARARTTSRGITYTPKPTQLAEAKVLECYLAAYPDAEPLTGPVTLAVEAVFPVPDSWSKAKKALAGPHTSRPDLDNLLKLLTDALNGVAFLDDSQVCHITAYKHYGYEPPHIKVTLA